jgi:hypothetical protein
VALVRIQATFVDPDVAEIATAVGGVDVVFVVEAALVDETTDAVTLDVRALLPVLGRQPSLPRVCGFDDMVVDTDDRRYDRCCGLLARLRGGDGHECPLRRLCDRSEYPFST